MRDRHQQLLFAQSMELALALSSVLAVSILDRLLHNSTTINIHGDSYHQLHLTQAGLPQLNQEDTMN